MNLGRMTLVLASVLLLGSLCAGAAQEAPTLDELLGRPEYPEERLVEHYLSLLRTDRPNILTIHAELEGMKYLALFRNFLEQAKDRVVRFVLLHPTAQSQSFL